MAKEAASRSAVGRGREVQIAPDKLYFSSRWYLETRSRALLSVVALGALAGIRTVRLFSNVSSTVPKPRPSTKSVPTSAAFLAANRHVVIPIGPNRGGNRRR